MCPASTAKAKITRSEQGNNSPVGRLSIPCGSRRSASVVPIGVHLLSPNPSPHWRTSSTQHYAGADGQDSPSSVATPISTPRRPASSNSLSPNASPEPQPWEYGSAPDLNAPSRYPSPGVEEGESYLDERERALLRSLSRPTILSPNRSPNLRLTNRREDLFEGFQALYERQEGAEQQAQIADLIYTHCQLQMLKWAERGAQLADYQDQLGPEIWTIKCDELQDMVATAYAEAQSDWAKLQAYDKRQQQRMELPLPSWFARWADGFRRFRNKPSVLRSIETGQAQNLYQQLRKSFPMAVRHISWQTPADAGYVSVVDDHRKPLQAQLEQRASFLFRINGSLATKIDEVIKNANLLGIPLIVSWEALFSLRLNALKKAHSPAQEKILLHLEVLKKANSVVQEKILQIQKTLDELKCKPHATNVLQRLWHNGVKFFAERRLKSQLATLEREQNRHQLELEPLGQEAFIRQRVSSFSASLAEPCESKRWQRLLAANFLAAMRVANAKPEHGGLPRRVPEAWFDGANEAVLLEEAQRILQVGEEEAVINELSDPDVDDDYQNSVRASKSWPIREKNEQEFIKFYADQCQKEMKQEGSLLTTRCAAWNAWRQALGCVIKDYDRMLDLHPSPTRADRQNFHYQLVAQAQAQLVKTLQKMPHDPCLSEIGHFRALLALYRKRYVGCDKVEALVDSLQLTLHVKIFSSPLELPNEIAVKVNRLWNTIEDGKPLDDFKAELLGTPVKTKTVRALVMPALSQTNGCVLQRAINQLLIDLESYDNKGDRVHQKAMVVSLCQNIAQKIKYWQQDDQCGQDEKDEAKLVEFSGLIKAVSETRADIESGYTLRKPTNSHLYRILDKNLALLEKAQQQFTSEKAPLNAMADLAHHIHQFSIGAIGHFGQLGSLEEYCQQAVDAIGGQKHCDSVWQASLRDPLRQALTQYLSYLGQVCKSLDTLYLGMAHSLDFDVQMDVVQKTLLSVCWLIQKLYGYKPEFFFDVYRAFESFVTQQANWFQAKVMPEMTLQGKIFTGSSDEGNWNNLTADQRKLQGKAVVMGYMFDKVKHVFSWPPASCPRPTAIVTDADVHLRAVLTGIIWRGANGEPLANGGCTRFGVLESFIHLTAMLPGFAKITFLNKNRNKNREAFQRAAKAESLAEHYLNRITDWLLYAKTFASSEMAAHKEAWALLKPAMQNSTNSAQASANPDFLKKVLESVQNLLTVWPPQYVNYQELQNLACELTVVCQCQTEKTHLQKGKGAIAASHGESIDEVIRDKQQFIIALLKQANAQGQASLIHCAIRHLQILLSQGPEVVKDMAFFNQVLSVVQASIDNNRSELLIPIKRAEVLEQWVGQLKRLSPLEQASIKAGTYLARWDRIENCSRVYTIMSQVETSIAAVRQNELLPLYSLNGHMEDALKLLAKCRDSQEPGTSDGQPGVRDHLRQAIIRKKNIHFLSQVEALKQSVWHNLTSLTADKDFMPVALDFAKKDIAKWQEQAKQWQAHKNAKEKSKGYKLSAILALVEAFEKLCRDCFNDDPLVDPEGVKISLADFSARIQAEGERLHKLLNRFREDDLVKQMKQSAKKVKGIAVDIIGDSQQGYVCRGLTQAYFNRQLEKLIERYDCKTPSETAIDPSAAMGQWLADAAQLIAAHDYTFKIQFCSAREASSFEQRWAAWGEAIPLTHQQSIQKRVNEIIGLMCQQQRQEQVLLKPAEVSTHERLWGRLKR